MNKNSILELFMAVLLSSLFFAPMIPAAPATATTKSTKSGSVTATSSSSASAKNNNTSCSTSIVQTSEGPLDVILHPSPYPANFSLNFDQKHIDYDLVITKEGGKQVFQEGAPNKTIHVAEGNTTVPYKFQATGDYSVNVTIFGILFTPINPPESAVFSIKVTPGQGALSGTAAIAENTINNSTIKNLSTGTHAFGQQQQYSFVEEWGSSSGYQFKGPTGVATDAAGNVYVADAEASNVMKFASDGKLITKWNSPWNNGSQFFPNAIAIDSSGKVYVADFYNDTIQKFTSDGKLITKWGSSGAGDGQFDYILGIAVDYLGNVYVADAGNHRVQKFDSNGNFITKWVSGCDWQLDHPAGIVVDHLGRVYVSDLGNNLILKFTSDGKLITKWGSSGAGDGQFNYPTRITADSLDNVYVADSDNHRVQKFDSNGNFITKWGSSGAGDGQLKFPDSIALDPTGKNVYVTDFDNRSVKVFTLTTNRTK